METATEETSVSKLPAVSYDISAERLAELEAECATLDPTKGTKAYDEARVVLRKLVTTRTAMDKKRKELKADSLAWGRLVDSEYKKWETKLLAIEEPVAAKIKAVDDAKENARRAKEEAERKALEAELEAKRAAEAAARKAEQDRIAEANRVEAERLAAIAAEQAAKQKEIDEANAKIKAEQAAAQKLIDDQLAEIAAAKRKQEQVEREAAIKAQAEKDAAERIERERIAAEERKAAQERADAIEKARIEAARPDVEKINSLAFALCTITLPQVSTEKALFFVAQLRADIAEIVERCKGFKA